MTIGEQIAIQTAYAIFTFVKCAINTIFWALDR